MAKYSDGTTEVQVGDKAECVVLSQTFCHPLKPGLYAVLGVKGEHVLTDKTDSLLLATRFKLVSRAPDPNPRSKQ